MYMLVFSQTIEKYLYTVYVYCGNKCLFLNIGTLVPAHPRGSVSSLPVAQVHYSAGRDVLPFLWEGECVIAPLSLGRGVRALLM